MRSFANILQDILGLTELKEKLKQTESQLQSVTDMQEEVRVELNSLDLTVKSLSHEARNNLQALNSLRDHLLSLDVRHKDTDAYIKRVLATVDAQIHGLTFKLMDMSD